MYCAIIDEYRGATYTFGSYNFRWCFKTSVSFAKDALRKHPDLYVITIHLGIYDIDVYRGYYDVWRFES